MLIERPRYLTRLVEGMGSHQVKVVTGVWRCGKSFLLFILFKEHLLARGVTEDHIVEMAFDRFSNRRYRDAEIFYQYVMERIGPSGTYYVLLDEVQLLDHFAEILIDLACRENVDVFVTGSNAHLLSRDVVTEFRGRADEIHMAPLSFSEFMSAYEGDRRDGYLSYITYGGMPALFERKSTDAKVSYLKGLFDELYIRDIVDRNNIHNSGNLEDLLNVLASGIGSLTNPRRLSDTFKTEKHVTVAPETIERYISHLEDAFLISRARRYDVKGRRYISTPMKYYFSDLGLRNARLNFRQFEETHLMENVIFNELQSRGYGVDVGVVSFTVRDGEGRQKRVQTEVDFVCNKGSQRCYVQSAYALPSVEKREQEERPLARIDDSFKKIIIVKEGVEPHYNERGFLMMNVYDFLLDPDSLSF